MKKQYLYFLCALFCGSSLVNAVSATENKSETTTKVESHQTQHPPHDHHDTDHLKVLKDMDKKRRKKGGVIID